MKDQHGSLLLVLVAITVLTLTASSCNLNSKVTYLLKTNLTKDDPDTVSRGQANFLSNCADCHGPAARGALIFPDVGPDLVEYAAKNSENSVAYKIASGKLFHMPNFDNYLDEKAIWDITNFLKYLAAQEGAQKR